MIKHIKKPYQFTPYSSPMPSSPAFPSPPFPPIPLLCPPLLCLLPLLEQSTLLTIWTNNLPDLLYNYPRTFLHLSPMRDLVSLILLSLSCFPQLCSLPCFSGSHVLRSFSRVHMGRKAFDAFLIRKICFYQSSVNM